MRKLLYSLLFALVGLILIGSFPSVIRGDIMEEASPTNVTDSTSKLNATTPTITTKEKTTSVTGSKAPNGFLTEPHQGDALDIALDYIRSQREHYSLSATDIANLVVTDHYITKHNGVTHIYLRQQVNGLELHGSTTNIHVTNDGRILLIGNRLLTGLAEVGPLQMPQITAVEAVEAAATHLGVTLNETPTILQSSQGVTQETILSQAGISRNNIPAKLMYEANAQGQLRLVWDLVINMRMNADWWNLRVDAITGDILSQDNWTIYESNERADHNRNIATVNQPNHAQTTKTPEWHPPLTHNPTAASYEVYAMPIRDPAHGHRTIVNDVSDDIASPYGWHDTDGVVGAEYLITRGNNVHAYADPQDIDRSSDDEPDGGPSLIFAHPINLGQQPSTYVEASTTNLFYWNNIVHDVMYHYGFDEVSGNFQEDNYGRGGLGGDPIQAQSQDGSGFSDANFSTPIEGTDYLQEIKYLPRMQIFLGGPGPWNINRDGTLDNHIIVHEYAHGITTRLVGGPSTNCLNGEEQGGEGWSDWYGNVFIAKVGDDGATPITVGNWTSGQSPNGKGWRPYPYSTSMDINPSTYAHLPDEDEFTVPHGVGSIWGSMIWDMYWLLVERDGFDPDLYHGTGGNNLAISLVTDGLRHTPCNPTFIDQRNGILAADLANNPLTPTPPQGYPQSENECLIWQAFATRGLGHSADDGGTNSRFDGTAAFDLPPQCKSHATFTVTATPTSKTICVPPAKDVIYTVDVTSNLGYDGSVTLSAAGQPNNTTTTFNPNGNNAPYTSTLIIGNMAVVNSNTYTLTITGTDNISSAQTVVPLQVLSSPPPAVSLLLPVDRSAGVSHLHNLTLSWEEGNNILSYTLEVATDPLFTHIIHANTTTTAKYTLTHDHLDANQTYYWRVLASNVCGINTTTEIFSITTRDIGDVLLIDNDNDNPNTQVYFTDALDALEVNYDVWDIKHVDEPTSSLLDNYPVIIWTGGRVEGISAASETQLKSYLDNGGCLFVSAQEYFYKTRETITEFMNEYLGVEAVGNDEGDEKVSGEGAFANLGPYTLLMPESYGDWSDHLTPTTSARLAFSYDTSGDGAALYQDTGTYKTTFWGFPFEAIPTKAHRENALLKVLNWCDAPLNDPPLRLHKTVNTGNTCGTGKVIVIPSGSEITYCYNLKNTGTVTYTNHTLIDNHLGLLLDNAALPLPPGATHQFSTTTVITAPVTNTAIWTATSSLETTTSTTDSATVHMITPMSFNQCLDFEDGNLPTFMIPQVTTNPLMINPPAHGRVHITDKYPHEGIYALHLDSSVDGFFTQQAAVLSVDLAGQTDVELNFWVREHRDEQHTLDNVLISNDNWATYAKILDLGDSPDTDYNNKQIDLVDAAKEAGLTLTDNFLIKFQSLGDSSSPNDGYSFDNICVQPYTPKLSVSKTAPKTVVNGQRFTYTISITNEGLTTATNTILTDIIPAGTIFAGNLTATSGSVSYNNNTDTVEWYDDIPPSGVIIVSFLVTVTATLGEVITNEATVNHVSLAEPLVDQTHSFVTIPLKAPPVHYHRQQIGITDTTTIALENIGLADVTWTLFQSDCASPVDIPWLHAAATNGKIPPDQSHILTLDIDTTNLTVGTYKDKLCLTSSHASVNSETIISVTLVAEADFTINFAATVGTEPNVCATTNTIAVPTGTQLTYCYVVQNMSNVAYNNHQLQETTAGHVFTKNLTLPPEESIIISDTITIDSSQTFTFTWTVSNSVNNKFVVSATDSVTITAWSNIYYLPIISTSPSISANPEPDTASSAPHGWAFIVVFPFIISFLPPLRRRKTN